MTNTKGERKSLWKEVFAAICDNQQTRTSTKKSKRIRMNNVRNSKQSREEKWKKKKVPMQMKRNRNMQERKRKTTANINITITIIKWLNKAREVAQCTERNIKREEDKIKACHPAKWTEKLINVKWHEAKRVTDVTKSDGNSNKQWTNETN